MKLSSILSVVALGAFTAEALLIPSNANAVGRRDETAIQQKRDNSFNKLWKRKGGGGGGKGGGSSSSGSKTCLSLTVRKTGSSSGGSSGGSARGSSIGGGSGGVRPSYGGGRYYGGGAAAPYTAGGRSARGIAPVAFLGVGALAFFPGIWLYGAYMYPYSYPYSYYNASSRANQTKPVRCICQQYSDCGCDDNDDPSYMRDLIGNGTEQALNSSLVRVANVNNTDTIFINGTIPNVTTASGDSSAGMRSFGMETTGWLIIGGAVAVAMSML
ncbi:hypothetical protein EJ08DRAFT_689017 [Tothia fuscella]|uniref:DUF7732 domain-containing protein n=1 Tax=Tothia fuscella TaxID=1048955 RepID=A0A9P4NMH8_9PEZI|nr:hypothetical protein EJ08DRAFT_689017 [Tothia fuscella]